jgi:alcohol dehydrogenase (cytochrome c)
LKIRPLVKKSALLLFVLIAISGVLTVIAPGVFTPFLPTAVRNVVPEGITHKLFWRFQVYVMKTTGKLPELSWPEIIQGTWPIKRNWPGSGFITDKIVTEGRSLNAAVTNPLDDPDNIEKGKKLFLADCAPCHGNDGKGSGHSPTLTKSNYSVGSSDLTLYKVLRDGIPGTAMTPFNLSVEERWQLIGFLHTLSKRSANKSDADHRAPPTNVSWESLLTARNRTDEWLTYSGALDGWSHSPLRQITPTNVSGLKLLWAHQFSTTADDSFEATPIVANKTIFITEPPNNVVALDAESGREIWKYVRPLPKELPLCCGRVNRGLAILGNTLFLGTLDAKLVAIDAMTGKVKWEKHVADPRDGFTITTAPLVAKNAVIIGVAGGEFGIRGFLAAYDAKTGTQLWRFHTVPGPGEFGHDTWKNESWKTGGGPTWVTGTYDPILNLLYWGVGNPSPNYVSEARPGDNLFTNSVIALDATTGKLAWYFQFTPNDAHDWDSNQTPVLTDLVIDGTPRKVICWANRNGFYYVLDRTNGEFLRGAPFVKINWASGLDEKGRPILTEAARVTRAGTLTEPWVGGGTNWPPPSFDPATRTFLVQATEGTSIFTASAPDKVRRGQGGLYVGSGTSTDEVPVNVVKALDAATGTIKWAHVLPVQQAAPNRTYSGVMSTDSGVAFLAFAGAVFALDVATGKELWHVGLSGKTQATPISFTLDGKQVVAVTAGKAFFVFAL